MAVQPVHQTPEEFMTQALGERVPVARAGRFTLYGRSKSRSTLYIHDKRKGPEPMPVASVSEQWGRWSVGLLDESFSNEGSAVVFDWWVECQGS